MDIIARETSIAALATRQRGVVTAEQLCMAGFDRSAIKRRLRTGYLRPIHRNVYLVGHAAAPEGAAEMAAMLARGDGSVISHRSAARLWKLPPFVEWRGPVEISVPAATSATNQGFASTALARSTDETFGGSTTSGPRPRGARCLTWHRSFRLTTSNVRWPMPAREGWRITASSCGCSTGAVVGGASRSSVDWSRSLEVTV